MAAMIGNPTQFDLNFRTRRVMDYVGKPLKGVKIHTYCTACCCCVRYSPAILAKSFFRWPTPPPAKRKTI